MLSLPPLCSNLGGGMSAENTASKLLGGWVGGGGVPPSVLFQLALLFGYLQKQLSTQSGSVYLCTCSKVLIAAVTQKLHQYAAAGV